MTSGSSSPARIGSAPEPVFILAPPRSYSTVTVALLAGHPRIFGFPELLIFSAATVGELLSGTMFGPDGTGQRLPTGRYLSTRLSGPYRTVAELHEGSQQQDAIQRAQRWLRSRADWPTERLLGYFLDIVCPQVGLEKSPDTVMTDESLRRCLRSYPQARYIHLTRHPVTAQLSIQEQLALLHPGKSARWRIVSAATMWFLAHLRIARALSALPDGQWIRLRSEDLLRSPRTWLPPVLSALDLPSDDDIIDRMVCTERWKFAGTGRSGKLFGGDHKFMLAPRLRSVADPGPVFFDPAWELLEEMCARMTRLARYLGYG